jgi:hypothetical protein
MNFTNDQLGCSFSVPDRPTVRQQLQYFALVKESRGKEQFERMWEGAKALISDWKCEALPDFQASLDDLTDPTQAQIVIWAGLQVLGHYNRLEDLPKN